MSFFQNRPLCGHGACLVNCAERSGGAIFVMKIATLLLLINCFWQIDAGAITLTATNTGAYSGPGGSGSLGRSGDQNYIAGWFAMPNPAFEYRDFFVFDLSGVTGAITGAQLHVLKPFPDTSPNPTDTFSLFDVSTDIPTLIGSSGSISIFSDLGSGNVYGSTDYVPSAGNVIVSIDLNATAILAMNNALGSEFALGGAVQNFVGGRSFQTIFGGSAGPNGVTLMITTAEVPEPTSFSLLAAAAMALVAVWNRRMRFFVLLAKKLAVRETRML
jgi:hypothetical protein